MSHHNAPAVAIGIDLGATHLRAALIEENGSVTSAIRRVLPNDRQSRRHAAIDAAVNLIKGHPRRRIDAVGLAVAGTVRDGSLTWSANLGLDGIDFGGELRAATGLPAAVVNGAHAAALAEARIGAGICADTMVMVTVGSGIGGGIVLHGRLHTGAGHAGEIGHLLLDPLGPLCRCGQRGCWERMAGGLALGTAALHAADADPQSLIAAVDEDHQPDAASLAQAASNGDRTASDVIRWHAHLFARGLDSLCAVLAPDLLVLGGGIIARPGPLRDAYRAAADNLRWHHGTVTTGMLGDNAGMIGAAMAARQQQSMPYGSSATQPSARSGPVGGL